MWQAGMFGRYLSIQFQKRNSQLFEIAVHDACCADDAEPFGIDRGLGEAGFLPGDLGSGRGELDVARHDFDTFARLDERLRIEVGNFRVEGGDPAGRFERGPRAHAAATRDDRIPYGLAAHADRRDDA
jgi:hypothetical protein